MSRFPMPRYPNGWFQVAYSDEVGPGDVVPLAYFGRDLVLFRSANGEARVLDAFCPHLGAHLGHGGRVEDGCLVCPFHAWRFDGDGTCVSVPYANKIPPRATIPTWQACEKNGMIMVWYHAEGAAPAWEIPDVSEVEDEAWTSYGRHEWKIRTHNQEMAENSCDSAHFCYLHGTQGMPESTAEAHGYLLHTHSKTRMRTPQGEVEGTIDVHAYGFGFTTTRFTGIVETLLVSSATTIDEDQVHLRFNLMVKNLVNAGVTSTVGAAFSREITRQLEQDIPIWENKIYVERPMLCDGDGPIGPFRRWARQFYSKTSKEAAA